MNSVEHNRRALDRVNAPGFNIKAFIVASIAVLSGPALGFIVALLWHWVEL